MLVLLLACVIGGRRSSSASWDYGDGRHGSFVLTTNATIEQLYQIVRLTNDPPQYKPFDPSAVPNLRSLTITNGATLRAGNRSERGRGN